MKQESKWERKLLGELVDINVENLSQKTPGNTPIEYIDIASIEKTGYIAQTKQYTFSNAPSRARRVVRTGDVIVSTVRPYLKAFALVTDEHNGKICSTGFAVLRPKKGVDSRFIYQTVIDDRFIEYLKSKMTGSSYPAVRPIDIAVYPLDVPKYEEQRKIAAILSSVDEAIEKTEAIIEQTEKVKKGLMQQLLTKGIGHTKFKKTEIGEIPEEWEVITVEEICDILDGLRKPIKKEDRIPGNIPYYGATGIIDWVNDYIFDEPLVLVGEDGENIRSRVLPMAFKIEGKSWVNNHAHVLRPKNNVHIDYLELYLESLDYEKYITGSAQPKLNQQTLRKIKIALPSKDEQITISNSIQALVSKLKNEKQQLSELEKIKKGLMQVLLTGKVRVKVDDEVMSQ
jgi:type I restriction enzyme, S subunit